MNFFRRIFLIAVLTLGTNATNITLAVTNSVPDIYFDSKFYLIDSLEIQEFSESDQKLLKEALDQYWQAKDDTTKCNAIHILTENLQHDSWTKYNFLLHTLVSNKIASSNLSEPDRLYYKKQQAGTLNNIGYYFKHYGGNIDSAIFYYKKGLLVWQELGNKEGESSSLNNMGYIYGNLGDHETQLQYYEKSLAIREEINDSIGMANSLGNLGYVYQTLGNIIKSLEYQHKSLKLYEAIGDPKYVAIPLNNIGQLYILQGETDKGLEYLIKGANINKETGNILGYANSLHNLGKIYFDFKRYDEAFENQTKSLELYREIGDLEGEAFALSSCGSSFLFRKDTTQALEYFNQSLKLHEEINNPSGMITTLVYLGEIELAQHKSSALQRARQAYEYAVDLGAVDDLSEASGFYHKVLRFNGDFENAYNMFQIYITMRDSLVNDRNKKETIRQQVNYEYEKEQIIKAQSEKEQAQRIAQELHRRNILQYSGIFIFVLLLFTMVLMSGKFHVSEKVAEGLIFFTFLLFFEFVLVLADPFIDSFTNNIPVYKLIINALLALFIFPAHAFFEKTLKARLVKNK